MVFAQLSTTALQETTIPATTYVYPVHRIAPVVQHLLEHAHDATKVICQSVMSASQQDFFRAQPDALKTV